MKRLALALLLMVANATLANPDWPVRVDRIELKHLSWTRDFVVLRELPWQAGDTISEAQWDLGLTRLWNTDLFSRIDAHIETVDDVTIATFDVEERFSLNPLLSFGLGGGAWWLRVGANDVNWLGRFLEWGMRYERFDVYNGGQGWLKDPRLFNQRLSGLFQLEYLFRPRPLYVRRRLAGIAEVVKELDDVTRVGLHLDVFHDEYLAPREGLAEVPPSLTAGQAVFQVRLGRVDTVRLRQRGWSLELRETLGFTDQLASHVYLQTMLEGLAFVTFGERFNLALRAQAARSSQVPTELAYYLGGLDLVRGYDDSLVRTLTYGLVNLEFRATLFDSTWFAVMAATFVDAAVAESSTPLLMSAGAGVRLLIPRLVKTGARADLAVTLVGRPTLGVSLGVYQFF